MEAKDLKIQLNNDTDQLEYRGHASTEQRQENESIHSSTHNTHARSKAVKQAHIRTLVLSYNYHDSGPEQPDLKHNELLERQNPNGRNANRLHKEASFAILFQLTQSQRKRYRKNGLGKRNPALPPLRPSELSTSGNRRR
ncbi:ABC transporter G family member 28-like [Dorcoceras hygrometricum]|uniref:ABC transporter G family member 28-like n=1 Tax=Dorcoceras hygrometricum TaxID=472368 RepID=A0A2Z7AGH4_9LAMI|nr:ABC transporter G family member 28-like [Dorcoceras hygrometricum]